ncbi:hypothetical protein BB560_002506 [Smittium megazygosporum]|uniref:DNA helicase n=1 Tax=Smittium megazygosporum TaxID=133381 RepID=A0A2T9ZEI8_9FUNG|nr:hypothetical protein BB560_002506 [Smittium megazygosporum]
MEKFINHLRSLLEKEFDAELKEYEFLTSNYSLKYLQKYGYAIMSLRLTSMRSGLGGKNVLTLETGSKLVPNQFKTGDVVELYSFGTGKKKEPEKGSNKNTLSGIVVKITEVRVVVSCENDFPSEWKDQCSIMFQALDVIEDRILSRNGKRLSELDLVLLGEKTPGFLSETMSLKLLSGQHSGYYSENLNGSQKEAVLLALSAREIALIHGPPGTGKTSTLIEIIAQFVEMGKKVLVCGPSNISVDNIAEKLSKIKIKYVRVGHPARVLKSVIENSLDYVSKNSEEGELVRDIQTELDENLAKLKKGKLQRSERYKVYDELKILRKELKAREKKVIQAIFKKHPVILSTLNGCSGGVLRNINDFDVVIVDEAGQALEPECWIAASKGQKLILAGDHLQLPPTIKSTDPQSNDKNDYKKDLKSRTKNISNKSKLELSNKNSLDYTMFERLMDMYGEQISKMITVQYRMNDAIMLFSSQRLYNDKLTSYSSNADHLLIDLPEVCETEETSVPFVFIDTVSSDDFSESVEENKSDMIYLLGENNSKYNQNEAQLVVEYTTKLVDAGLKESEIAIISPYNAQVYAIRELLSAKYPGIEIGSVDGFQGREKVRSNSEGEVGFLSDYRRINVAITRAKRHLCIVGNSETLSNRNKFLRELCDYGVESGELRFP